MVTYNKLRFGRVAATAAATLTVLLLSSSPTFAAPQPVGGIDALGCIENTGAGGACSISSPALNGPSGVAISPDGTNVYVASRNSDAIAIFTRGSSGSLTYTGCIKDTPAAVTCAVSIDGLLGPSAVAVSSDGANVYVSATDFPAPGDTFFTFDRGPGGTLTNGGFCFRSAGPPASCANIGGFDDPQGIGLSPDGGSLYVVDNTSPGGITRFTRAVDGDLTFGVTNVMGIFDNPYRIAVSPDGGTVYTAGSGSGNVVWIPRNPDGSLATGSADCIVDPPAPSCGGKQAEGLNQARGVAVSPDGKNVYVASPFDDAVATFNIGPGGALTSAGCIMDSGSAASCGSSVSGLDGAYDMVVSPDGENLYVASSDNDTISAFTRAANGSITPINCVQNTGGTACGSTTPGLNDPGSLALSPDGINLYAAAYSGSSVVWFGRNRTPACTGTSDSTTESTPIVVTLYCTDANGDPLTRQVVTAPTYGSVGSVDQAAGTVTYTPAVGFTGTDSFTFTATDGGATATPATATITVGAGTSSSLSLTDLKVDPKRFRRGSRLPKIAKIAKKTPTGAKIKFKLSEDATVKLSFKRKLRGRKVGKKCRRATKRLKKRKRCNRFVSKGSFSVSGKAGQNKVRFDGRLKSGRRLPKGRYLLTATPTSSNGVKGLAKSTSFTLLKAARHK